MVGGTEAMYVDIKQPSCSVLFCLFQPFNKLLQKLCMIGQCLNNIVIMA